MQVHELHQNSLYVCKSFSYAAAAAISTKKALNLDTNLATLVGPVSVLEVYNKQIRDLLVSGNQPGTAAKRPCP
ncbi:hypothetical protein DVH24_010751 [Malus domestica]|uniref:Kinesin motor domain-containing protein n=1 Tax=Malus domestica TaxID=3750 RepID=A0A498JTQ2_MALDO|nr:hypothetical protein DVH24_010751 [Malus domestica]